MAYIAPRPLSASPAVGITYPDGLSESPAGSRDKPSTHRWIRTHDVLLWKSLLPLLSTAPPGLRDCVNIRQFKKAMC